jgi:hypothetical protein
MSVSGEEEDCVLICPDLDVRPMEALLRILYCKVKSVHKQSN